MQTGAGQPRIVLKAGFTVVGLPVCGGFHDGEVEALWDKIGKRFDEISNVDPDCGYGLHTWRDGVHCYLAGLGVNGSGKVIVPEGMKAVTTGTHAYAVFVHRGLQADLPDTVSYVFKGWLPQSEYQAADNFYFEYYDDRFQPGSPDSVIFVYVPVVRVVGSS